MKFFLIILIFCINFSFAYSIEIKIIHKIQNEIITNVDIKNEFKYLLALNNKLKELNKEKIFVISSSSIIREKIKNIELLKNFKEIKVDNNYLDTLIKNTYERLGLKSEEEFILYLENYELTLKDIKKKLTIDALWNQLIYEKYNSQITIDEKRIKNQIKNTEKKMMKEYKLSEIIFEVENKDDIKEKYQIMTDSINEIGFNNTASIYSISDTSKVGGEIGWVKENMLNDNIKKNISSLSKGKFSKPIILSNGVLILKIIDIKKSEVLLDYESELKKITKYEKSRQLNQYSKIYFNKVKKNLMLDE
ncbi:peptidylprolyl isomerase [Candidatus Pelagibacter sp.]|jgi:peptidyl-prolyl cis-trans isomerase SurA|nr:peptidylprolyl isomerase [Candidatus Pelagibacter sp.]